MRRPAWLSVRWWSSRSILTVSFCAFAAVLCILLGSNRYMADCVQQEAQAKDELASLIALGQQLADASDLLTNEVRAYAETEDITYLNNYWTEVLATRQRDAVIQTLENDQLPDEEAALLAQAKRCSDLLIDTETRSMHLILAAAGQNADDFPDEPLHSYVTRVTETPLSGADTVLSAAQKRETARQILYDAAYERAKYEIMSPIEQFRQQTSDRLENEVACATAGRRTASEVQIFCLLCSLVLIAAVLWLLMRLYIVPLRRYTDALSGAAADRMRVRVTPCGASEPYRFGQMFNRLRATLERELENRRTAEEQMRQARDEADSANRAKSEFLAQMSHELHTPLGAVTGYLYLLERTPLNAQQKRYCSSMYTSSEALMELINQILDFSKIEAGALTFETVVFDPTVLLVDDSEINLVMECELLRSFGLQVDTAASAGDALRLAEQRVYDLVLLDIRMPDMDGYELAKRLRRLETYRAVPLLALTADAVGSVRERALDAGMNDCITKPVRPDRLHQVLRRYFALAVDAPETLATDHGGLFRRERALATLGGDREQLAALCRRFLRAHSRSAEYVRLHLEHGRPANARALLYDLIGLAGNLGCDALSGASRVLLDEVHHGRMDTLPQFTEVFDRTIEELRSFAETQTEPFGKPMEQVARKLKKLVENYDFSVVQWFEQHGGSLRHTMQPERFARLSEALEQLDKERFDLIVTDIRMPFIDGLELLRELRRRGIQTPVILVSAYGEFEYAREGLVLGAFDYIVKPFCEEQLNAVLSRAAQSLSAHTDEDSQYALVRETFETIGIPVQEDGFVHTLAAFLAAHLNGMITMEQAAEHLGLSKDYFGKRCRSHTGMAFGALYNQVRVAYARQLLRESTDKAGEISERLGFASPDYFTRIFKDITGCTPSLLRLIRKAPDIDRACAPSDRKFVSDDKLFRIQAWIIRELAKSKPCIIIGKCANHISCGIGQTCSACMWKRRARPAWSPSCRNPA